MPFEQAPFTDICIRAIGETTQDFYFSAYVLAERSECFRSMLTGDFVESKQYKAAKAAGQCFVIEIQEEPIVVEHLLMYLRPSIYFDWYKVPPQLLIPIIELADKLLIEDIKESDAILRLYETIEVNGPVRTIKLAQRLDPHHSDVIGLIKYDNKVIVWDTESIINPSRQHILLWEILLQDPEIISLTLDEVLTWTFDIYGFVQLMTVMIRQGKENIKDFVEYLIRKVNLFVADLHKEFYRIKVNFGEEREYRRFPSMSKIEEMRQVLYDKNLISKKLIKRLDKMIKRYGGLLERYSHVALEDEDTVGVYASVEFEEPFRCTLNDFNYQVRRCNCCNRKIK